ncbi:hypothetical protein Tco_0755162 [Tanacetum coccineum]
MLVQGQILQGERSRVPVKPHHTPSSAPTTLQPPLSSPFRIPTKQETKVPQPSSPTHTNVADEAASIGVDVRHGWAATTVSSLDVGQGNEDEEDTSKHGRSMTEDIDQVAGVTLVQIDVKDQGRFEDETDTQVLADATRVHTYTRRRRTVSTGSGRINTASRLISTAEESVSTAGASMPVSNVGMVQESIPSPNATKDKGKAIMQESEQPKKIKKRVQIQMSLDEELAQKLHEEEQERFNAEQEAKFNAEQEELLASETTKDEANPLVVDVDWDDDQAQIQADEDLAQSMLEEERESLSIAKRARLLA